MHRKAYVLLLLTTLFWGGNAIAGKLATGHISPMLLTTARWTFALAIIGGFGWRRLGHDRHAIRASLPLLIGLGFAGFAIFNVALYAALVRTTAINVSIEQGAIPMLIFLLNFVFFRIPVGIFQVLGLVLSIAGVVVTASHGEPTALFHLDVNSGDAVMIFALVAYSIYSIFLRFRPAIHWQSLMIILTAAGALTSLPFTIAEFQLGSGKWPDARGWLILAYVVVFPSLLAQIFYIAGVEMLGANRAGLFINLVPVFGTLLSVVILREAFHAYHAVALLLVFSGIGLAERGRAGDQPRSRP